VTASTALRLHGARQGLRWALAPAEAAGARLCTDVVAFNGSTSGGRAIGAACGRLLRTVTLELGGKSAAIVLDHADLG
jgi:aldehyde dehydrogenase (NAD+)